LLQLRHNLVNGRANKRIVQGYAKVAVKLTLVGVRVLAAGIGAVFIHKAKVICSQKRAGGLLQNIIAVFVNFQVLSGKITGAYAKMFRQPFNIFGYKAWAGSFAAVGAVGAVNLFKGLVVQLLHGLVKVFG